MSKAELRRRLLNDRKATGTYKQELRRSLLESHGFSVNTDRQVVTGHDDEDYYVKGYGSVSDEALIQTLPGRQKTTPAQDRNAVRQLQTDIARYLPGTRVAELAQLRSDLAGNTQRSRAEIQSLKSELDRRNRQNDIQTGAPSRTQEQIMTELSREQKRWQTADKQMYDADGNPNQAAVRQMQQSERRIKSLEKELLLAKGDARSKNEVTAADGQELLRQYRTARTDEERAALEHRLIDAGRENRTASENARTGSYLGYTANMFGAGLVSSPQNIASGLSTALIDLATGGDATEGYKKLDVYFAQNRRDRPSGAYQDYEINRIASETGIRPNIVEAYLRATDNEHLTTTADEMFGRGLNESVKEKLGQYAYTIGQQIPGILMTAGAPAGDTGGVIGNIMDKAGIRNILKSAGRMNLASGMIGASAAGSRANELARTKDYSWKNYLNAGLNGYLEAFTENLFGFSDAASFRRIFDNPSGSPMRNFVKGLERYFLSSMEEGLEEVVNVPLQGLADKLTTDKDKPIVGDGGIFDWKEMLRNGIDGAVVAGIMGGVSGVASVRDMVRESGNVRIGATYLNAIAKDLPETMRPAAINPRNATQNDLTEYEAKILDAYHKVDAALRQGQNMAENGSQTNPEQTGAPVLHTSSENDMMELKTGEVQQDGGYPAGRQGENRTADEQHAEVEVGAPTVSRAFGEDAAGGTGEGRGLWGGVREEVPAANQRFSSGRLNNAEIANALEQARVSPKRESTAQRITEQAAKTYGAETVVVPDATWDEVFADVSNPAPVMSRNGKIYVREGVDPAYAKEAVPHESTHILLQADFRPYTDFLATVGDKIDFSSIDAQLLLDRVRRHIRIKDGDTYRPMELDDLDDSILAQRFYDELCATLYGYWENGVTEGDTDSGHLDFRKVFYDFDSFMAELADIHRQFQDGRTGGIREKASVSGRDSGTGPTEEQTKQTEAAEHDTAASSVDGAPVITEPNPEQDVPFTLEYNDTIQSGRQNKVPEITIQVINRIAKKLGVKVLFEKGGAENGRYENGIIYINTASKTPVADTFFHELTHHLETSGMPYHDFQNAVFESAVFRDFLNGESIADYRNRLIEMYRRNGVRLDEAAANNEMVARFVESRLFQNQESINRLARENRTLFQRIRAWLRDLATRLKGTQFEKDLLRLQRMYEAAAAQAKGNISGQTQFSIQQADDGSLITVIDTDQGLFLGVEPAEYSKIARAYLKEHFTGVSLPVSTDDSVKLYKTAPGEYAYPNITLNKNSPEYMAKMRAATELDNLLQTAEYSHFADDQKNHAFATHGFDYYKVNFILDGQLFSGLINIGTSDQGRVFYDITKVKRASDISDKYLNLLLRSNGTSRGSSIRPIGRVSSSRPDPTTNSLMRIEHSDGTYPHPADGNSQTRTGQNQQGAAVDTNISRSDTGVNTQDMQEQPKYSFGGEQAKLANRVMLQHAKSMQRAGVSPAEIWEKTGWYEGLEGRWKFEINDREMQFDRYGQMNGENRNPQKLSDFIRHDKLFENYPELKDVNFKIDYLDVFHYGQYDPTTNTITLSRSMLDLFPEDVIVHEIQHVIQNEEGFTPGASGRSMHYENTAGEIEARDVSSRRRWTDTQRRAQLPDQGDGEVYFAQNGIQLARQPGKDLMDIANLTENDANTTPKLKPRPQTQGDRKSRFGDNVRNTSIFDPQFQTLAEQDANIQTYDGIANRETMQKANETLNSGGQAYVNELLAKAPTAYTAEDAAAGFILMSRYQATGDYKSMLTVAEKLREAGTAGGQTVQMFSILSRMTPEGMVYYAQKSLSDALKTLSEGKYKQWADKHKDTFKLSDEDVEFIRRRVLQAQKLPAGRDKNILLGEISALIQSKTPSHFGDKTNTLARISMLLNPKTNVRNILGNVIITPQHILSDYVGALADKLISMKTGQRTTGTFRLNALAGMKKGLFESYDDFRRHINTREIHNDRFEIGKGGPAFAGRTALGKSLNALDRVTSFLLDAGDRPFYETWFINSLNNQMRLNNVKEPTAAMIDIATQEALQRTWQDDNGFSKVASRLRNTLNFGKKFGLGSLIVPFTKTPANLTKAIVDFSPVGLVKAISADAVRLSKAISRGEATPQIQKQFVSSLSKGVTGTLAMLVFGLLTKAGILSGAGDEDKDVADFEKNILGIRPYSVKIGGKSYSYDWAQPVAGNMAIVADFIQNMEDGKDNYGILKGGGKAFLNNILNALSAGGNILYEQSFMQGVQDFFKEDGLMQGVIGAITDAPSMFTPSILGQVAQYDDDTMRTSYVYNDPIATSINQVKAKIPGLSKTLEPVVDVYGNEVKRNGGDNSIFNVFFNPSNVSSANSNKAAEEVYRLYQETGDKTVFPVKAPYYFTVKGEKYIMTPAERTAYQKLTGEIAREEVSDLASFKPYSMLTDEEKIKIITNIYQYGTAKAKEEISDDYEMPKDMQKVSEAKALGVRPYQYLLLKSQYDQDGNDSVTQDEVIDVLNKSGLTRKQKAGLYALQNANWKNNPYK